MSTDKMLYELGRAILEPLHAVHLDPSKEVPSNAVVPKDRTYLGHCIEAWLAAKLGKNEHNLHFTYEYVYSYDANEIGHVFPNLKPFLDVNQTYTIGMLVDLTVANQYGLDMSFPEPGQIKGLVRNMLIPRYLTVYITGRATDVLPRMFHRHPESTTTTAVIYDLLSLTQTQGNWFALKTPVDKFWNKVDYTIPLAQSHKGE